jgi:hypothetical protein
VRTAHGISGEAPACEHLDASTAAHEGIRKTSDILYRMSRQSFEVRLDDEDGSMGLLPVHYLLHARYRAN